LKNPTYSRVFLWLLLMSNDSGNLLAGTVASLTDKYEIIDFLWLLIDFQSRYWTGHLYVIDGSATRYGYAYVHSCWTGCQLWSDSRLSWVTR
jgi:hypothetical protein